MFSRSLIRTKILQHLYDYSCDRSTNVVDIQSQLLSDIEGYYILYLTIFDLLITLRDYSEEQIAVETHHAKVMHTSYTIQRNFVDNSIIRSFAEEVDLPALLKKYSISWQEHTMEVGSIYKALLGVDEFQTYLQLPSPTEEDDSKIVVYILSDFFPTNESLLNVLDDMARSYDFCVWDDGDLEYVSFLMSKMLRQDEKGIIPYSTFLSSDDKTFATTLLYETITHYDEYMTLQTTYYHTNKRSEERIAKMDSLILLLAITELKHFSDIPRQITMNEYIDLSKVFSTPKSYAFINGVLETIMKETN